MSWVDLPAGAPVADVTEAWREVLGFLLTAPPQLRRWARHEIEAIEHAAVLSPPGDPASQAQGGPNPAGDDPAVTADDPAVTDQFDEDLADQLEPTGRSTSTDGGATRWWTWPRWLRSRQVVVAAALAVIALVVMVVYRSGQPSVPGISGSPSDTSSPSASAAPLDQAKVAELMRKISANPKDFTSLAALGDLYFEAADYTTASTWQKKALEVDPQNVTALLALGASQFNLGNGAQAEQQWLRAVALDPKQAEAHYDLGFLYLSQDPPNLAKVRQEWGKVVEIDPTSQIAKTVTTHLQSLQSPAPSGASAPTPAQTPDK